MNPGEPAREPAILPLALVPEHELLRPIASGAYGQVWLARNRLGVYRAVKVVHRVNFDHDRPFEREFEGIKAFEPISRTHDGLVDLLQVGRDDSAGYFYYVMELADGLEDPNPEPADLNEPRGRQPELPPTIGQAFDPPNSDRYLPRTLGAELKRRGRFPLEECIRIGFSLSDALAHLHGQGLVHRDVKPSNIIFVDRVPKLADIGLVTSVDAARSFVGTEGFIPPEGPGTPQADIYSLGIVLYTMSTGKSHQAFPEPLPDLATQPEHARRLELDAVIHKACQAEARARYQSAEEIREELALLERGGSVKRKRAAQRRWGISKKLGLAAVGAGLLITTLLLWNGTKREYTPNSEAARLYGLGKWYYNQLTPEAHLKAFEYLNEAIKKDPKFVQPYRELTALYVWEQRGWYDAEQRMRGTKEIADKLLALNPDLAEAHTALGWYNFLKGDLAGAESELLRAIELDANYSIAHDIFGFILSLHGRVDEAIREGQRSQELDPTARAGALVAAFPYFAARQFDRAIEQANRALDLDKNFAEALNFLGRCYEAQSNYLAAIEVWERYDTMGHDDDAARVTASYAALREAYNTKGQEGYLWKYIELIRENARLPEAEQIFFLADIAGYYAMLGEKDKALHEIEKQFDDPTVRYQLKFEPLYATMKDDPRFQALLRRAGLER